MFTYVAVTFTWAINNMLSRAAVLDSANYAQITTGVNGTALVNSTFKAPKYLKHHLSQSLLPDPISFASPLPLYGSTGKNTLQLPRQYNLK